MIGKLKGTVDSLGADWALIDVHGVCYLVACSSKTLAALNAGEACVLAIETHVREDMIKLFGFANDLEREWFKLLNSVQGVGTKVALAILSTLKANEIASAIALKDKVAISRTPGVGPKVAERIINELKDKAPSFGDIHALPSLAGVAQELLPQGATGDALSALINLGYAPPQAQAAINSAYAKLGETAKVQELIRAGLKELSA
jgi:holliday junction DNA helicase RuvA